jgi:hypothetical protein
MQATIAEKRSAQALHSAGGRRFSPSSSELVLGEKLVNGHRSASWCDYSVRRTEGRRSSLTTVNRRSRTTLRPTQNRQRYEPGGSPFPGADVTSARWIAANATASRTALRKLPFAIRVRPRNTWISTRLRRGTVSRVEHINEPCELANLRSEPL